MNYNLQAEHRHDNHGSHRDQSKEKSFMLALLKYSPKEFTEAVKAFLNCGLQMKKYPIALSSTSASELGNSIVNGILNTGNRVDYSNACSYAALLQNISMFYNLIVAGAPEQTLVTSIKDIYSNAASCGIMESEDCQKCQNVAVSNVRAFYVSHQPRVSSSPTNSIPSCEFIPCEKLIVHPKGPLKPYEIHNEIYDEESDCEVSTSTSCVNGCCTRKNTTRTSKISTTTSNDESVTDNKKGSQKGKRKISIFSLSNRAAKKSKKDTPQTSKLVASYGPASGVTGVVMQQGNFIYHKVIPNEDYKLNVDRTDPSSITDLTE